MTLTPEEKRARQQAYMRRYRELHPNRQEESRRYWQKHKEAILAKRKAEPVTDKDRKRAAEYARRWRQKYPDKFKAAQKRHKAKNPGASMKFKLRKQEAQAGRPRPTLCEICGNPSIGRWKTLHFDHCHQRGIFRGWICNSCNVVLGYVKDDPNHLRKLIAYLEATTHEPNASYSRRSDPACP